VALIHLHDIHYSIGAQALLEGVSIQVAPRERIGLLGRNGQGKSTLLRILSGELEADRGRREVPPGVRLGRLAQEVPELPPGTVFAAVAAGLGARGRLQVAYRAAARRAAENPGPEVLAGLAEAQQALEAAGGWIADHEVERVLTPLGLDPEAATTDLSAGFKRRVLLAQALVAAPEVLLLDEPTNHLDLVTIQWLEETLLKTDSALVLVTHDRAVLQALATRIVELDRGHLYAFPGDYHAFLARKEAALAAEEGQAARQDRELAREEAWIRQGVKARRRRNQGRVRALERLRDERRQRREALGDVRLRLQAAEQSGKLVLVAEGVSHRWGDRWVFQDLSTVISRGDRVGIVGPNGAGKTTLLQILLGRLTPERGKVRHGTRLQVAYFDQLRAQLDEERSVADNVAEGNDRIVFNGRTRHVMGYLSDFLFTVERARQPVKALSGGEKNRLLLARLFARPANLLVLDEPTNDLDLETLELLEERLYDYDGTILVVSHDRVFLDQVATGILAFEGDGRVNEYVGGYSDWRRQRRAAEAPPPAPAPKPLRLKTPPLGPRKLTFKEQKELEALPGTIERLEAEQANIFAALGDPGIYKRLGATVPGLKARLGEIETELAAAYARWEELEGRAGG
jgi:ATP-binding cassette subfamily F protein uup